jgi:hypothetical protein
MKQLISKQKYFISSSLLQLYQQLTLPFPSSSRAFHPWSAEKFLDQERA